MDPQQQGAAGDVCLLVEDQVETREGLTRVLQSSFPGLRVEALGSLKAANCWLDGHEARSAPGFRLALIDLGLPDGSGIVLVKRLTEQYPAVMAVVATIYNDDAHLFDAIAAGAKGYLLKDSDAASLSVYLRRIEAGEPPLTPSIAWRIMSHFQARPAARPDDVGLTARETEVLSLIASGLTAREAAAKLGLSAQTVMTYIKVIYQKLNVQSRAQATLAAAERGLISR